MVATFSKLCGLKCRTAHTTLPTRARGKPAGDTAVTSMPSQWEEAVRERKTTDIDLLKVIWIPI